MKPTEARFRCAGCNGYFVMPPVWCEAPAKYEGGGQSKPYCRDCAFPPVGDR